MKVVMKFSRRFWPQELHGVRFSLSSSPSNRCRRDITVSPLRSFFFANASVLPLLSDFRALRDLL